MALITTFHFSKGCSSDYTLALIPSFFISRVFSFTFLHFCLHLFLHAFHDPRPLQIRHKVESLLKQGQEGSTFFIHCFIHSPTRCFVYILSTLFHSHSLLLLFHSLILLPYSLHSLPSPFAIFSFRFFDIDHVPATTWLEA